MTELPEEERQKRSAIIYQEKQRLKNIDAATYGQGTIYSDIVGLLVFLFIAYFFMSLPYYTARLIGSIISLISFYWIACISYKLSQ